MQKSNKGIANKLYEHVEKILCLEIRMKVKGKVDPVLN
jgi:hypothetical protein